MFPTTNQIASEISLTDKLHKEFEPSYFGSKSQVFCLEPKPPNRQCNTRRRSLRFNNTEKIGSGDSADVFFAEPEPGQDLSPKVAIKQVRYGRNAKSEGNILDQSIAEMAHRLISDNEHIPSLYASHVGSEEALFVMELISGGTLSDAFERNYKFSERVSVKIARQLAGALLHMHELGVAHGDITDENVFLHKGLPSSTRRDESYVDASCSPRSSGVVESLHAYLGDFGDAFIFDAASYDGSTYCTKRGTVYYNSPQADLNVPRDLRKNDVFSLGVLFYEMIAHNMPFDGSMHMCDLEKWAALKIEGPKFKEGPWKNTRMVTQDLVRDMLNSSETERPCMSAVLTRLTTLEFQGPSDVNSD